MTEESRSFSRTVTVAAETLYSAREKLRAEIPCGCESIELVLSDGNPVRIRGVGPTQEAAIADATRRVPEGAEVRNQTEVAAPGLLSLELEANNEAEARRIAAERHAIISTIQVVTPPRNGIMGIGRKPGHYLAEARQSAVVELECVPLARVQATFRGRSGDGSILGDLIAKGLYLPQAGVEKVGYFNPAIAPFRTLPGPKVAILRGAEADAQDRTYRQTFETFGGMFYESSDSLTNTVLKLCRVAGTTFGLRESPSERLLKELLEVSSDSKVGEFLLVTSTVPFFLNYSTGQNVHVVTEVEQELRLNAVANLLLADPTFSDFRPEKFNPPKEIARRIGELLKSRRAEVEEKKAWAESQKARFS